MTPSEVQTLRLGQQALESGQKALDEKLDALLARFDEQHAAEVRRIEALEAESEQNKQWRWKAQGAAKAFGLMWLVATFGIGVALALLA